MTLTAAALSLAGCPNPRDLPGVKERIKREGEKSTRETEEAIQQSPVLQELNRLCTKEIPLPDGFHLVVKSRSINTGPFLSYGYYSEADYQRVKAFYIDYFTRNGWRITNQKDEGWGSDLIEFSKDSHKVEFYHGGMDKEVNYSLVCWKLTDLGKPGSQ